MAKNRKTLVLLISLIILSVLGTFIFFNSRLFIKGPQIEIFSPKNGSSFEDPFIEILGKVQNVSFISIDDNPIFIDESGNFSEKLILSPGVSIIEVYAYDTFKRDKTILLQYVYNGTSVERNEKYINTSSTSEEIIEEEFINN